MSFLTLESIQKSFGGNQVVKGFDLAVDRGEFVSFLGPSGCGKTTVLRMVAGLESASAGRIVIADRDVTHLPPNKRDVGMVFQSYALFPNMTVRGNIAFGLKLAKSPVGEVASRVDEMLAIIKLNWPIVSPTNCRVASNSASRSPAPWR
jgi:putative spermidine/putrescine transport system ATP-binding protein